MLFIRLSEECFSTLLHLLLSPLSLSDHNQVCKAWRFFCCLYQSVTLPPHSHCSLSLSHTLSISFYLGSVLVQISNIKQGRLRSSWSVVPSLICPLPPGTDVHHAAGAIHPFVQTFVVSSMFLSFSLFYLILFYLCPFHSPLYWTSVWPLSASSCQQSCE